MPRGGARPNSGPAPEAGSLAEAARLESGLIRHLPRERTGKAPRWPLSKATPRELVVWRRLWKKPQAIVWEEQGLEDQVGFYVRTFVEAEEGNVAATRRTLLLQQENVLLLNTASLMKAGYRISTSTARPASSGSAPAAVTQRAPSSRGRLMAVPNVGDKS